VFTVFKVFCQFTRLSQSVSRSDEETYASDYDSQRRRRLGLEKKLTLDFGQQNN